MPLSFPTQPPSLWSLSLRPLALNLLTSLMGAETKPSARWAVEPASSPFLPKQGPSSPSCKDKNLTGSGFLGGGYSTKHFLGVGVMYWSLISSPNQQEWIVWSRCLIPCSPDSRQRKSSLCSERRKDKHRYQLTLQLSEAPSWLAASERLKLLLLAFQGAAGYLDTVGFLCKSFQLTSELVRDTLSPAGNLLCSYEER